MVLRRRAVANAALLDEVEIFNEQVPWLLLKERSVVRKDAPRRKRVRLFKPEVDLSRWPGHGAPFLKDDKAE